MSSRSGRLRTTPRFSAADSSSYWRYARSIPTSPCSPTSPSTMMIAALDEYTEACDALKAELGIPEHDDMTDNLWDLSLKLPTE